jgi:hypothetical protein
VVHDAADARDLRSLRIETTDALFPLVLTLQETPDTERCSAWSVAAFTSFSNKAEALGLASSSRATRMPASSRSPFALSSYPMGMADASFTLPLSLVVGETRTFWPSAMSTSSCRHSR